MKGKVGTIIILLFTLILAGVAIFTAVRLYQLRSQPVAPNVPSSIPRASSVCGGIAGTLCTGGEVCIYSNGSTTAPNPDALGTCGPAPLAPRNSCSLSFSLAVVSSPTPSPTPGVINISAQCSASGDSATLTWNAVAGATKYNVRLDQLDNNASTCTDGWYCSDPPDKMLDNLTTLSTSVVVAPGKSYEVWVHYVNADGVSAPSTHTSFICNTSNNTPTPTGTPNPSATPNACNGSCGSNFNCQSNYVCYQGFCRNPSCTTSTTCGCGGTSTPAPTGTPAPSLPQSGTDWPTVAGFGVGIFVILGSLLLAL